MKRYTVHWYVNIAEVEGCKRLLHVGVCSEGKAIAFLADDCLKPLMIGSGVIDSDGCQDGKWCLAVKCPHNRARLPLKEYGIADRTQLDDLAAFLERMYADCELKPSEKPGLVSQYEAPIYRITTEKEDARA